MTSNNYQVPRDNKELQYFVQYKPRSTHYNHSNTTNMMVLDSLNNTCKILLSIYETCSFNPMSECRLSSFHKLFTTSYFYRDKSFYLSHIIQNSSIRIISPTLLICSLYLFDYHVVISQRHWKSKFFINTASKGSCYMHCQSRYHRIHPSSQRTQSYHQT